MLSDPDGFECPALFSSTLSPSIATSSPVSSLLLGWITPCASSGPVPLVRGVVFGTCCSVVFDCSALTSHGPLFNVILLLLSDSDELGCPALFWSAPSLLITTSPPMSALLLVRATSWVGPVLTSLVTSPCASVRVIACGVAGSCT